MHISLSSYVLRIRWTLPLKRGGSTTLRDSLTGWACPPTTNNIWGCLKFVSTPFYVVGSPQSSPLGLRWCSAFASHPFGANLWLSPKEKHKHTHRASVYERTIEIEIQAYLPWLHALFAHRMRLAELCSLKVGDLYWFVKCCLNQKIEGLVAMIPPIRQYWW